MAASFQLQPPSVASAPGKVLLAGGYLVLDREYTGLVFGLSARIHVVVQSGKEKEETEKALVVVKSPQFRDAEWRYEVSSVEAGAAVNVTQVERCEYFPFSDVKICIFGHSTQCNDSFPRMSSELLETCACSTSYQDGYP